MSSKPSGGPADSGPYGSAKDLPSYRELAQQIQGGKVLTLFIARAHRKQFIEIQQQLERLVRVVDDFYDRLGARNWIFNEMLSLDDIERLLGETTDAESAEALLIELYLDEESTKWWIMRLRAHHGLRRRSHQIERAREHYLAGHFDSCVLQLIAVMDGFVNDFEPGERRGLHAREPDDMAAWNSVVGHHMGLTHAMSTFKKTIKKRVDYEVFEVYRNGIVHGSIVNFDNAVVATKAWNMLFAVSDWATARLKAAEPTKPPPTLSETWAAVTRHAAYQRHKGDFSPSTIQSSDPDFTSDEVVVLASQFLDAWEHERWGIVAAFTPPALRGSGSDGQAARHAKNTFENHHLTSWSIESVTYDQASAAAIRARATVGNSETELEFRMVFWTLDGNLGIPGRDEGGWRLAVWAPHTFLRDDA